MFSGELIQDRQVEPATTSFPLPKVSEMSGVFSQEFATEADPTEKYGRGTLWHILSHYSPRHEVREAVYTAPSSVDLAFIVPLAERLIQAYRRMAAHEIEQLPPEKRPNSGIWEMTKHEFHGPFHRLIAEGDVQGFALYMNNAMRETITHGLGPGRQVFEAMATSGEGQAANVLILIDRLASVAEAIGARRCENPEQGTYGAAVQRDATEIVRGIEAVLGVPIGRPAVMGNFGLLVDGAIIDVRVPDDAYTAYRVHSLLAPFGLGPVCEIGAGLGGTALQALRMGVPRYMIADIPVMNIVQGWFLAHTLGPQHVQLFGEPDIGQAVKLLPYWEFYNPANHFDLVVNRDSLPEIPAEHAIGYIDEIARRRCHLLSINQEGCESAAQGDLRQLWVRDLVAKSQGFRCLGRHRAWTREGYVEEFFAPA
jgi:hypothetical protein